MDSDFLYIIYFSGYSRVNYKLLANMLILQKPITWDMYGPKEILETMCLCPHDPWTIATAKCSVKARRVVSGLKPDFESDHYQLQPVWYFMNLCKSEVLDIPLGRWIH